PGEDAGRSLTELPLSLFVPLLFATVLWALAHGLGLRLLTVPSAKAEGPLAPLAPALGLGVLATALFLLGLAGRFTVGALAVVMIVALVFVAPALAGGGGWRPAAP